MATWPIQRADGRIVITPHGKYGQKRNDPSEGGCGVGEYPCTHWGVDLAGEIGTPVVAPESGVLMRWGWGDEKPFSGYGPAYRLLVGNSGWYHLLAHLRQDDQNQRMAALGSLLRDTRRDHMIAIPVREGELMGVTSGDNHVHWEVRRTWDASPSKVRSTMNPGEWLKQQGGADPAWAVGITTAETQDSGGGALIALAMLLYKDL